MTSSIEPMIPSDRGVDNSELPILVLELERKAATLAGMVNPITAKVLEEHLRVINSYYSNLIEGNPTLPRDIRKAMNGEYNANPAKRDLQLESLAHIEVQRKLAESPPSKNELLTSDFYRDIHRMFYEKLPDNLKIISDGKGKEQKGKEQKVTPGQFRQGGEDVEVGQHLPPEAEKIDSFLRRYGQAYKIDHLHGQKKLIAAMAAHHRFEWIHPFLDGNGRLGRLHTDLFLKAIGLGACGIWCLSRGLARTNKQYKSALARADFPRQGDGDGRGALSEGTLISFCEYMINAAIGQVDFMTTLLDLKSMNERIQAYIDDRNKGLITSVGKIKPEAARLIEKAFIYGEIKKGEMDKVSGLGSSVTRKLVQQMKEEGLLTETSSRSPLRWAIPDHAERYYLPELSPEK